MPLQGIEKIEDNEGSNPSLSAIHFAQSLSQQGVVVSLPIPDLQLNPQDARSDAQNSTGHGAGRPVALDDLRHGQTG